MALVGDTFYVANADARGQGAVPRPARPRSRRRRSRSPTCRAGTLNHHWTKSLVASRDGSAAVRRRRLQQQRRRERHGQAKPAAPRSGRSIRRPARIACSPRACAIRSAWTGSRRAARCGWSVNERDELGSDLVPDYMTSVRDGGFYGWPYSYYGQHVDARVQPPRPDLVAQGDRARLRARPAYRIAGPGVLRRHAAAGAAIAAARSSASTAPGTASRPAATR